MSKSIDVHPKWGNRFGAPFDGLLFRILEYRGSYEDRHFVHVSVVWERQTTSDHENDITFVRPTLILETAYDDAEKGWITFSEVSVPLTSEEGIAVATSDPDGLLIRYAEIINRLKTPQAKE